MVRATAFGDYMDRLKVGDNDAAREFVKEFEPLLHLELRRGIRDSRLAAVCDPLDMCQLVLASFFARTSAGQFELTCTEQLVGLLLAMARKTLACEVRRQYRQRRDVRRVAAASDRVMQDLVDRSPSPYEKAALQESLNRVEALLTSEELELVEMHDRGLPWRVVATAMGGSGAGRRMQLMRALKRVGGQLQGLISG